MEFLVARLTPAHWFGIALATLVPIAYTTTYRSEWINSPPKPSSDGSDYENLAFHLWRGEGFVLDYSNLDWQHPYRVDQHDYSSALGNTHRVVATGRPPFLPLLISGIYVLVGRNQLAFVVVRLMLAAALALAAACSVWLTAKLLDQVRAGWRAVGCLSTLVFATTHRTLYAYATDFLTEPVALLIMQLLMLSLWHICQASRDGELPLSRQYRPVWIAGVLMGVLIMTRSLFVVWLPGMWLLMLVSCSGTLGNRMRKSCIFVGLAVTLCMPWWIRNMVVLERAMPLGTQGPITLLGGYADESLNSNGDWQLEPILQLQAQLEKTESYQLLANDTHREIMLAEEASRRVHQWIVAHWVDIPGLMIKRVYVHWNPYSGRSAVWKLAVLFGIVACIARRQPMAWWLVGTLVISTGATAMLYSTGGRFLVPLYGVLYTLAGLGIVNGLRWAIGLCPVTRGHIW